MSRRGVIHDHIVLQIRYLPYGFQMFWINSTNKVRLSHGIKLVTKVGSIDVTVAREFPLSGSTHKVKRDLKSNEWLLIGSKHAFCISNNYSDYP